MALREFYPTASYREHRYRECAICGFNEYMATLDFTSGTVDPTVGETLTGATSGNTGVVVEVALWSGTYAGGDAAGRILLTTITGWDQVQYTLFTADEVINGSTSGAGFLTVGNGDVKVNNRLSPEGETAIIDGARYCKFHYEMRFPKKYMDEAVVSVDESDRTAN